MSILALHTPKPADNVVHGLRKLADMIEAGEFTYPVTTCVAVIGHTDGETPIGDGRYAQESHWNVFGYGPRNDTFTVRGLLASALRDWDND